MKSLAAIIFALMAPGLLQAGDFPVADLVIIEKDARDLHLLQNGEIFKTFKIALGIVPVGDKAAAAGVDPGGAIMIHGQPNVPTRSEAYYRTQDWTNGCIAVSNSDMIDIWLMTDENTPIEIRP